MDRYRKRRTTKSEEQDACGRRSTPGQTPEKVPRKKQRVVSSETSNSDSKASHSTPEKADTGRSSTSSIVNSNRNNGPGGSSSSGKVRNSGRGRRSRDSSGARSTSVASSCNPSTDTPGSSSNDVSSPGSRHRTPTRASRPRAPKGNDCLPGPSKIDSSSSTGTPSDSSISTGTSSSNSCKPGPSHRTPTRSSSSRTPSRRYVGGTSSSTLTSSNESGSTTEDTSSGTNSISCTTDTSSTNTSETTGSSSRSASKRELRNLKDAWSASVSPFRTRGQSEESTNRQTPRRQIKFSSDESSTSCYPPDTPTSVRSCTSDLASSTDSETMAAAKNLEAIIGKPSEESQLLSSRDSLKQELQVSTSSEFSSISSMKSQPNSPKTDVSSSESNQIEKMNQSAFPQLCKKTTGRVSSPLKRKLQTVPKQDTPDRKLRSRNLSGVQATTSKAASSEGFSGTNTGISKSHSDSVSSQLKIVELSSNDSLFVHNTNDSSLSEPLSTTDEGFAAKKPKLTKLMTILTSEHDYFKKTIDPIPTSDSDQSSNSEVGRHIDTNNTFTIYTLGSSVGTNSGHPYKTAGSSSIDERLSMARSDNALSCIPSDHEGSYRMSSLATDSHAAVSDDFASSNMLSSECRTAGSPNSEDVNLGFNLSDYVIRRRRLRSESTKDELWEGFPAITPFRKQGGKAVKPEDLRTTNSDECSSIDDKISNVPIAHRESSSSTSDLISEIDSILSDTQTSYQQLINVSSNDVTQFHEDTNADVAIRRKTVKGATKAERIIDKDINSKSNSTNSAEFSNQSVSQTPSTGSDNTKSSRQLSSLPDDTPSDTPTTPRESYPESVWWSEKSTREDWASSVDNPLKIEHGPQMSSDDTQSTSNNVSTKVCDSVFNEGQDSAAAVDISVFRDVAKTKANSSVSVDFDTGQTVDDSSEDNKLRIAFDSNSSSRAPSAEESDGHFLRRFKVSDGQNKSFSYDQVSDESNTVTSPNLSKSETTSSNEFLLWTKKKNSRKVSFPKIVLRKCKESTRLSKQTTSNDVSAMKSTTDENATEQKDKPFKEICGDEATPPKKRARCDEATPPKRSSRLRRKSDDSKSSDFVYAPLKKEDSKSKSSSQSTSSDSCSKGETKTKSRISHPTKNRTEDDEKVTGLKLETAEAKDRSSNNKAKPKESTRPYDPKKRRDYLTTERFESMPASTSNLRRGRRGQYVDEELLTNPVIDKHACVLWSSEHRRHFQQTNPEASPAALDELLRTHWTDDVTDHEKMKYFTRARDAVLDEDKHAKRGRRETRRSGREKSEEEEETSSLERFTRLKIKRQKDLLTKWLHFFQKVLSRREYAEFIEDVKQAILKAEAEEKPNKTRGLTSKIFSHKKLLFLKMNELKDHVMQQYCHRRQKQKDLRKMAFDILVGRLIEGKQCAFIKGCRSRVLSTVLRDIKDLEYNDSVDVLGYPIATSSFTNLYKEIVETVDSCMFRDDIVDCDIVMNDDETKDTKDVTVVSSSSDPDNAGTSNSIDKEDPKSPNPSPKPKEDEDDTPSNSQKSVDSIVSMTRTPPVDTSSWFDIPTNTDIVDSLLDNISKQPSLPVLQYNTLDSIFLPPPPVRVPMSGPPINMTFRPLHVFQRVPAPNWTPRHVVHRHPYPQPRPWAHGQIIRNNQGSGTPTIGASIKPLDLRLPRTEGNGRLETVTQNNGTSATRRCTLVRDVMYSEAREAFSRAFSSNSDSCCDMDSPSCILSTLVAADKTNQ